METQLSVDLIDPNQDQPRKLFRDNELQELAASIVASRLIQAIKVRPKADGRYEIVAGERRWRAHKLAGLATIRCVVEEMDEEARDIEAIIENLQRADITRLEQGRSYKRMLDQGMPIETLARKVGKGVWRIQEAIDVLNLRPEYQQMLEAGQISTLDAQYLAKVGHTNQDRLFRLMRDGKVKNSNHLRALAAGLQDQENQGGMFSDAESGKISDEDDEVLTGLERKIETIAAMARAGFNSDNAVAIAKKVAPHRAKAMADRLELIQQAMAHLSKELRRAGVQFELAA